LGVRVEVRVRISGEAFRRVLFYEQVHPNPYLLEPPIQLADPQARPHEKASTRSCQLVYWDISPPILAIAGSDTAPHHRNNVPEETASPAPRLGLGLVLWQGSNGKVSSTNKP
jgi:hypothetical protein